MKIIFDGDNWTCPVCKLIEELSATNSRLEELQAEIDDQKDTISTLNSELDAAAN